MKSEFSTAWKASKQPRKQRKYRFNAPLHIKQRFLSANISKELRKKYGKRNLPLRKGDEVLVMRGSFKKKKAKVSTVYTTRFKVALENIQRTKKDGTKVNVYFHPSILQIILLGEEKNRVSREQKTNEKTNSVNSEIKKVETKSTK